MNFYFLAPLFLGLLTNWAPTLLFAADEGSNSLEIPPEVTQLALGVKSRPRWEVGVGVGHIRGFDYPASRDHNRRSIALPFFVYRARSIRFGGGGIRAVAIENPRIKLDLSVGGSLNANSSGDGVREGMPDLDFLFEIGPQLEVRLRDELVDGDSRLQSRFTSEIRAVFVTDFEEIDRQGLVAEAGLDINLRNVKGTGIDIGAAIDFTYANEKLQDYFYEVPAQYATPIRPEFDAKGGYLESKLSIVMGFRPHNNVVVFAGAFTGFYDGAANEDSPLFETTSQIGFALGAVWTLAKSRTMVEIVELGRSQ
ncbi:MAG: outer membrane protein [Granulosicoccus sp.]|jgi:outer membrane protein